MPTYDNTVSSDSKHRMYVSSVLQGNMPLVYLDICCIKLQTKNEMSKNCIGLKKKGFGKKTPYTYNLSIATLCTDTRYVVLLIIKYLKRLSFECN